MKTSKILVLTLLSVLTFSCSKNETETPKFSSDETAVNAKIDLMNEDVSSIVEGLETDTYTNASNFTSENNIPSLSKITTCGTISRDPAFGTPLTPGTVVTKTIDFGTDGCALANGNTVKGKIVVTFTYQPSATTHTITYTFTDFYHNAIKYNGSDIFTREMSVGTQTSPSHPIVTMNINMAATLADGRVLNRVGERVREIMEGYGTAGLEDNVYQVTGSWTTTYPNSSVLSSSITSPLIIKMSCLDVHKPLLVQGVITHTRNGRVSTLNYGEGICDNLAVLTINGIAYNIIIGN